MKNTTQAAIGILVAAACVLATGTARADRVSFGLGISGGDGSFLALGVNHGGRGHRGGGGPRRGWHGPRVPHVGVRLGFPPACPPPVPVVVAPPAIVYAPAPVVVRRGYWQEREERVWIEGCWVETFDPYGRRCKTWQPGRWEIRRTREWVE